MSEELKCCPFCGAIDAHHQSEYGDESQFVCAVCDARGPMKRAYADALTAWNRRATPQAGDELASDVRRLVIAARIVAFENQGPEALRELDQASEAFASRVPWENEDEA